METRRGDDPSGDVESARSETRSGGTVLDLGDDYFFSVHGRVEFIVFECRVVSLVWLRDRTVRSVVTGPTASVGQPAAASCRRARHTDPAACVGWGHRPYASTARTLTLPRDAVTTTDPWSDLETTARTSLHGVRPSSSVPAHRWCAVDLFWRWLAGGTPTQTLCPESPGPRVVRSPGRREPGTDDYQAARQLLRQSQAASRQPLTSNLPGHDTMAP